MDSHLESPRYFDSPLEKPLLFLHKVSHVSSGMVYMLENILVRDIHTALKMQGILLSKHSAFLQDLLYNQLPAAHRSNILQQLQYLL